jgi:site-specific recombinase XerD
MRKIFMRRRETPDGLPYRLYERHGMNIYSVGFKAADGTWTFRLRCKAHDRIRIMELRREAIRMWTEIHAPSTDSDPTFGWLGDEWIKYQESLPANAGAKRSRKTLEENKREINTLKKVFGEVRLSDIQHAHGVQYVDECARAVDADGKPRPRIEKGNKEISLAKTIFAFAKDRGWMGSNPFSEVRKAKVVRNTEPRYVTDDELNLVLKAGRAMGGPYHIMALCFQVAYYCSRRSVEARALTRDMLRPEGVVWTNGKQKAGEKAMQVLIKWHPALRACIDEALACPRNKGISTFYVFGNMSGQQYTKGGWKANLTRLMARAGQLAEAEGIPFQAFSLQECRPKAVSDSLEATNYDYGQVMAATMHTTPKMLAKHYDRKRLRRADPVPELATEEARDRNPDSKVGISQSKRG